MNNTDKELIRLLKTIFNNYDFILGVMSEVKNEKDKKDLINYIKSNSNITAEEVSLISLEYLNKSRQ